MKNLLLILLLAFSFTSCEKDDSIEPQKAETAKVIGTWELYIDERLESVIDQWTGTEFTYKDEWYQNVRDDSGIILEFKSDGTFLDKYVDVVTANGTWGKLTDGRYYFDYNQESTNGNDALTQKRFLTVHCDNTYSLEIDGNDRAIDYYRITGSTECGDLITYNVE
jgi:hypothetical protein